MSEAGATLEVVAGALVDARGRVLIAERPPGKSMAGRWEFPGGKRRAGEASRAALERELAEELGVAVAAAEPLLAVSHHYPGAAAPVRIDCWRVSAWRGTPAPLDGQRLRWCAREQLLVADILEADAPIVSALVLPETFVGVPAGEPLAERLPAAPAGRIAWLVTALPSDPDVVRRLETRGDRIFVVDPPAPPSGRTGSVYSASRGFRRAPHRRAFAGQIVAGAAEAVAAVAAGADFLLVPGPDLGPAELTAIGAAGLPWYLDAGVACDAVRATGRLHWPAPLSRL